MISLSIYLTTELLASRGWVSLAFSPLFGHSLGLTDSFNLLPPLQIARRKLSRTARRLFTSSLDPTGLYVARSLLPSSQKELLTSFPLHFRSISSSERLPTTSPSSSTRTVENSATRHSKPGVGMQPRSTHSGGRLSGLCRSSLAFLFSSRALGRVSHFSPLDLPLLFSSSITSSLSLISLYFYLTISTFFSSSLSFLASEAVDGRIPNASLT